MNNPSGTFKIEVVADSSGKWCGNAMLYATREEAVEAAKDLFSRWLLTTDWRVCELKPGRIDTGWEAVWEEVQRR